jgi:DNA-binding transcriptional ArsR family regulator
MSQAPPTARAPDRHILDYELDDIAHADTPDAMKALANATRTTILHLLLERAATTSQLAEVLEKPKGTVGYHLNVLADVGLVRVVRTRQVRAMTEKYYGRTGRTIVFGGPYNDGDPFFMLHAAISEAVIEEGEPLPMFTLRHARIPVEVAVEFSERILEVVEEFIDLPRSGNRVFGLVAGIYPSSLPAMQTEPTT